MRSLADFLLHQRAVEEVFEFLRIVNTCLIKLARSLNGLLYPSARVVKNQPGCRNILVSVSRLEILCIFSFMLAVLNVVALLRAPPPCQVLSDVVEATVVAECPEVQQ